MKFWTRNARLALLTSKALLFFLGSHQQEAIEDFHKSPRIYLHPENTYLSALKKLG
jgi:hypothetical protein